MTGRYADWQGHVIVCGLHSVGLRIVEQLNLSGVPAVVVDDHPDPTLARQVADWGVPHIQASARTAAMLTEAGLAGATAVICVLENDLQTLETALLTRELRADVRVVVQLANPAVGRALAQINVSVLDVAGLSAPAIAEACLQSGTQEITLDGERFLAARTTATRRASLRELYGALAPIAVLPAGDEDVVICPGRDHEVAAGDRVTLFATPDELRAAGIGGQIRHPAHARPPAPRGGSGTCCRPCCARRPTGGWRPRWPRWSSCWSPPPWYCTRSTGCPATGTFRCCPRSTSPWRR